MISEPVGRPPIRIMIVDDHPIVREGLVGIIGRQSDAQVVAEAGNGFEAIEAFRRERPDITLMDLRMPGLSGVEAITAIRKIDPHAKFIVLTTYDGDEDIYRALQAGAQSYLLKDMFRDQLLQAIRTVWSNGRYIPSAIAGRLATRLEGQNLSGREMQILREIVRGQSNKEIATSLGITEPTVKGHVTNLLSKLGVSDRTQAVTVAIQRGFVHL